MCRSLAALLFLAACAPTQPGLPAGGSTPQTTRVDGPRGAQDVTLVVESNVRRATVAAHPEAVWDALQATYAGLGLPVTVTDPQARLIGTREQRLRRIAGTRPSRFLECGSGVSGPNADQFDIYLTLLSQVQPASGGATEVRTQLDAQARDPGQSGGPVRCGSTGALEQRIMDDLQKRLGGGAG